MVLIEAVLANENIDVKEIKTFKIGDVVKLGDNSYLKINDDIFFNNLKQLLFVNDKDNICVYNKQIKYEENIELNNSKEYQETIIKNNDENIELNNFKLEIYSEEEISLIIQNSSIIFSSIILKYLGNEQKIEKIKSLLNQELKNDIEEIINNMSKSKINYINIIFDFFEKQLEKERIKIKEFI